MKTAIITIKNGRFNVKMYGTKKEASCHYLLQKAEHSEKCETEEKFVLERIENFYPHDVEVITLSECDAFFFYPYGYNVRGV